MKKIITALTLSSLLFFNTGCSSDDNSTPPPPSNLELLTGKWNIKEEGEIVNGFKDIYEMDECTAKDTYDFTKDFKYINEYHEKSEANQCMALIEDGTWTLKNDNTLIINILDREDPTESEAVTATITKLTSTLLYLEQRDADDDNIIYYLVLKRN